MKCGVKFCGGCNPRYQRGDAYRYIKGQVDQHDYDYADEDDVYDTLLVIGGCPACCASYKQYDVKDEVIRMWDETHIDRVIEALINK